MRGATPLTLCPSSHGAFRRPIAKFCMIRNGVSEHRHICGTHANSLRRYSDQVKLRPISECDATLPLGVFSY